MKKNIFLTLVLFISYYCLGQNGTYQVTNIANPSFSDLAIKISSIAGANATIHVNKTLTLNANLIVPENISLKFYKGAVLNLNSYTLTINGPIDAGCFQIFNGIGVVNGSPQIDQAFPEWWQNRVQIDWTNSIQNAVNFYPKVFFQSLFYQISDAIKINPTSSHILKGNGSSSIIQNISENQFAFEAINTTGYDQIAGIVFEGLRINSFNGIKLNNDNGSSNFNILLNCKINKCSFYSQDGYTNNAKTAISMFQVFDSTISENYFQGFEIGIKMSSCDINIITDNRIMNFFNYAILDLGKGNLGSQNSIIHNDLLGYLGGSGKGAFIKTTSRHIIIRDNFCEIDPSLRARAYIDCSKIDLDIKETDGTSLIIDITGNRFSYDTVDYCYLVRENFKTLNINEANIISNKIPKSSFCKDLTTLEEVDFISLDVDFAENVHKVINIVNCESFNQWQNFAMTKSFYNSNNGSVIINSKSLSTAYDPAKRIKISPNSFKIKKNDIPFWIKIDQKLNSTELSLLPKKIKLIITTRNTGSLTTTNSDYFIALANNPSTPVWGGYGTYLSNNTTQNNFVKYSSTPEIEIDPTKDWYLVICANVDVEIKSIEIVDVTPIEITESIPKEKLVNQQNEIKIETDSEVKLYPIPTKDKIRIEIKANDILKSVELYTETGALIGDFTNNIDNKIIDISSLPSASYIVKITTLTNTSKIIIKK